MRLLTLIARACEALYLGFASLNWMAKDNLIGGIYSPPVAIGIFFAISMALLKSFFGSATLQKCPNAGSPFLRLGRWPCDCSHPTSNSKVMT